MNDIASEAVIIATVLGTTFFRVQAINSLRSELVGEIRSLTWNTDGLRAELMGKLDSIQRDMRELHAVHAHHSARITNLEQQQKN